MQDIINYESFTKIEPVNKGWSNDKKYYVETSDNKKLLLRITNINAYNKKRSEFELMKKAFSLDIPMSQPVDFGICDKGNSVYTIFTWCGGDDAETVLPILSEEKQYELGFNSGIMLKKIHSIPVTEYHEDWERFFNFKINNKLEKYKLCGYSFDGDYKIINYIENNRHLISDRPQSYHHGDYHVGNMIISPDNLLYIIDFNRYDIGDPWEEFNRIVWSASVSPFFATGQLNGYFNGKPPMEFFKLLEFYISSNTISSISWAIQFGQDEINTMKKQANDVLNWFDNMNNPIPNWYLQNFS